MAVLVIALGFAVLFQFIILRIKWRKKLYADVGVDVLMLALLNGVFGGSILGVISATAGSTLISLYLIWYPIKMFQDDKSSAEPTAATGSSNSSKNRQTYEGMAAKFDRLFD